ncbi:NAD(P)-dependent oxidoreductase [Egibacter rhizosphaerae]|uniref:NAD(P)-dependent oxidoreductase n=1 Tax=Egibacter rhizosphaerae TaxID=1670831 RepID=A0A411YID0_9ACTN|nr:NAD(P)-dependent oxidoreductase [Egibacter rhizosphaerae]QBI20901.1 NAD(P)-dependent oxidoreductase [Egibacter rhizosphaerae]
MADIALIGTGRMGAAMAGTLARSGTDVVLFNRTRATAEAVAEQTGAAVARTAAEAAASAPVVLTSLSDDNAVRAAFRGPEGVLAGATRGALVLETSTIDPQTVLELGPEADAAGVRLLDAPVSGSVPVVERGELVFMIGGEADAVDRARDAIAPLARKVVHVGDRGAGATMKLAVNGIVHALNMALSEALVLAERAGVDRGAAYEVIASSAVAAPFVEYKRQAFEHPEEASVAFSLDLVDKDLDLILQLAERVDLTMQQAAANRGMAERAVTAGLGSQDMSAVAGLLRGELGS